MDVLSSNSARLFFLQIHPKRAIIQLEVLTGVIKGSIAAIFL